MNTIFNKARRVVIKLGTGILTSGIGRLNTKRIDGLCQQVAALRERGLQVIIVSSGAVGLGMGRLGLNRKPKKLSSLQKCAAVGQSVLIETWQRGFQPHGMTVAQLLLTREDVRSRKRHVAVRDLLDEILADGIVPVINENDSVSAAEIKFGDNDVLSAMVASMTRADLLIILSTAPGVVDRKGGGNIVPVIEKITPEIEAMAGGSESITGTGGMITKLQAAKIATYSGCAVFIGSGEDPSIVDQIFMGQATGTLFIPRKLPLKSRQRWMAFFETPRGLILVDDGAREALCNKGKSLLAKGITSVEGTFDKGDVIAIGTDPKAPFAHGIAGFSSDEIRPLIKLSQEDIRRKYPGRPRLEIVHHDSLVML